MCKSSENDLIEKCKEALKKDFRFFSNACKPDREVWVVKHFLLQLGIEFSDEDIHESSDEPVDVNYCDAKFQIKEIMDNNRKRRDEYKESLRKTGTATSYSDLLEHSPLPRRITFDEVVSVIAKQASKWKQKYGPSECMSTDLLFYFNLQDIYMIGNVLANLNTYSSKMAAWRSVSVLSNSCAFVLHVSEDAPDFLKKAKGKVYRKLSD